jgi:hypothetical protein
LASVGVHTTQIRAKTATRLTPTLDNFNILYNPPCFRV